MADDAKPAKALLLACARAAVHPSTPIVLPEEMEGGWDAFLALAARNRLLPLVHRALSGVDGVPGTVRSRLRDAFAESARQALRLAAELRRLTDALEAAGIAVLAYKGPALAVRAYGHLALRTYSDLDLLVAPEDEPAAARVLVHHGYACAYHLTPAQA